MQAWLVDRAGVQRNSPRRRQSAQRCRLPATGLANLLTINDFRPCPLPYEVGALIRAQPGAACSVLGMDRRSLHTPPSLLAEASERFLSGLGERVLGPES